MPRLIIGHVGPQEARIWVRGDARNPFGFLELRKQRAAWRRPQSIELEERHFYTGVIELDQLDPGARYHCRVSFGTSPETPDGQREVPADSVGTFHTAPAPGTVASFNFVLGSCNLHSMNPLSPPKEAYRRISRLAKEKKTSFMIHCGDQIYADIPVPPQADLGHFRNKYLDAWDDCETARRLLTEIPHYMILDDHEICNNFFNDPDDANVQFVKYAAVKVYREFQHIHNPQTYGTAYLHYSFDYGQASFFVMDTRTERYIDGDNGSQMIDPEQFEDFQNWLTQGDPKRLKFVVTSVPFVGEVRRPKNDKWNSPPFLGQREQIIERIATNGLHNVFFLTGDMHNSYYARMNVTGPSGDHLAIHELMSSPINQLGKSKRGKYEDPGEPRTTANNFTYTTNIVDFYGGHSNVMCVNVSQQQVGYEIYRTKRERDAELSGTVTLV